jgi:hypothetical protein
MNITRLILFLYPVGAAFRLWLTNAKVSEHFQTWDWRWRNLQELAWPAAIFWLVLWLLLRRAKRDRLIDSIWAISGLCVYLLPWVGIGFGTVFGLWLSWDLRKP